jgi:cell division protein FtsW (lipid II flippase)
VSVAPAETAATSTAFRLRSRALHASRIDWLNPAWICIVAALALSLLGIAVIATTQPALAARQSVFLGLAVVATAIVAAPHYRWLQLLSLPLMIAVAGLLVFVLIPWIPEAIVSERKGARRWINLGVTDFQPSELAKIVYIIALAAYLRLRRNHRSLRGLMLPFVLTFIPMVLIPVEPDLGTSLLFLPTLFAMLVAAGARLWHLALIVTLGLATAPAVYPMLQPHQKDRILALYYQLKNDRRHVQGIGYQGDRAMRLVGSGQLAGVGRGKAADLVEFNHLPEEHNDMVFAVIACRWGLAGALVTWGLFGIFIIGGLFTAGQCKEPFGRLLAIGIVAILFAQMTINTAMTIGLLPITGMTLPFVSYGGSSLITTWMMAGLLLNIGLRRPQFLARESFDFDRAEEAGLA